MESTIIHGPSDELTTAGPIGMNVAGAVADAAATNPLRTGFARLTGGIGASATRASGSTIHKSTWSPNLPAFWKFKAAIQANDHVALIGWRDVLIAGNNLALQQTAAGALQLVNFAGATQNFALVLAPDTVYTIVLIAHDNSLTAQIRNAVTEALLEQQGINYIPAGNVSRYVSVSGTVAATRWLDYRSSYYCALCAG